MCIIITNLIECQRNPPLIWLSDYDKATRNKIDSDKEAVKKWVMGELDCDCISDSSLVRGFEFPSVICITNHAKKDDRDRFSEILTRSMVQYMEVQDGV